MSLGERRLVAIMFTDMAGFTSLGQKDEALAMELLEEQRSLVRSLLAKYNGKEVKTIGDAFLVEFASSLEAVKCAVEIQSLLKKSNEERPEDRRMLLRIGVHLGDVIHSGTDLAGDAVNVASRIQALAPIGGVCVTEPVYESVMNKVGYAFESLGIPELKNVSQSIEVYEVSGLGQMADRPTLRKRGVTKERVAVLPFVNMSPDPDDEYFADGLTEEMITELSKLPTLSIIARTSVMHYKKTEKTIKEIAKDLEVTSVLEGSVRKARNRIRVTAQLIDARSEAHLWAAKFDTDLGDILAVQSEVAERVAKTLEVKLAPKSPAVKLTPEQLEVYTLGLRAKALWNRRTKEANEQAMSLYKEVLSLDSQSAKAYAGLADCYLIAAGWHFADRNEALPKAEEYVVRALELDESLPEPHATLGYILTTRRRYNEAEVELKRAIALNPNYATAHQWYYQLLLDKGKLADGFAEITRANELDPLSPVILWHFSYANYFLGRTDVAMSLYDRIIQTDPGFANGYIGRSYLLADEGRNEAALADLEIYRRLSGDECGTLVARAEFEAIWGNKEKALRLIEETRLLLESSTAMNSPFEFYAVIGDKEEFFKWIARALEQAEGSGLDLVMELRYNPKLNEMRKDNRFRELFKKYNLSGTVNPSNPGDPMFG